MNRGLLLHVSALLFRDAHSTVDDASSQLAVNPVAISYVADSSFCLYLPGGEAKNGKKLGIWECNGHDDQNWIISTYGNGRKQIAYAGDTSKCIDVRNGIFNGNEPQIWDCDKANSQFWDYDSKNQTVYIAGFQMVYMCLDLYGGNTHLGSKVNIWECDGGKHQQWTVAKPMPPPTPTHGDWPSFDSFEALSNDAWGVYYKVVYGSIPEDPQDYPITPKANWMLYQKALRQANVTRMPPAVGNCPTAHPPEGQHYLLNNRYSPALLDWIWHPYHWTLFGPAYKALEENTWVEVMHQADPFGDESIGAWFLYTPGSGIYMNTGRTRAFRGHEGAYKKFGVAYNTCGKQATQECMSAAAAKQGYDSLQFTAWVDHVNYPCDTFNSGHAGLQFMGVEIVAVKGAGTFSCGGIELRAGWKASRACSCNIAKKYTNCDGVPDGELETEVAKDDFNSSLPLSSDGTLVIV